MKNLTNRNNEKLVVKTAIIVKEDLERSNAKVKALEEQLEALQEKLYKERKLAQANDRRNSVMECMVEELQDAEQRGIVLPEEHVTTFCLDIIQHRDNVDFSFKHIKESRKFAIAPLRNAEVVEEHKKRKAVKEIQKKEKLTKAQIEMIKKMYSVGFGISEFNLNSATLKVLKRKNLVVSELVQSLVTSYRVYSLSDKGKEIASQL